MKLQIELEHVHATKKYYCIVRDTDGRPIFFTDHFRSPKHAQEAAINWVKSRKNLSKTTRSALELVSQLPEEMVQSLVDIPMELTGKATTESSVHSSHAEDCGSCSSGDSSGGGND